jgi:hypothetical protein
MLGDTDTSLVRQHVDVYAPESALESSNTSKRTSFHNLNAHTSLIESNKILVDELIQLPLLNKPNTFSPSFINTHPNLQAGQDSSVRCSESNSLESLCVEYENILSKHQTKQLLLCGSNIQRMKSIFSLVRILWSDSTSGKSLWKNGYFPEQLSNQSDVCLVNSNAKSAALSKWITEELNTRVDMAIKRCTANGQYHNGASIFWLLAGHRVQAACKEAESLDDLRLALLIAQAGENDEVQKDLHQQIALWQKALPSASASASSFSSMSSSAGRTVWEMIGKSTGYQEIFSLLAGSLEGKPDASSMDDSQSFRSSTMTILNEKLDWEWAFALQLWYGVPRAPSNSSSSLQYQTPLSNTLKQYKQSVATGKMPSPAITYSRPFSASSASSRHSKITSSTKTYDVQGAIHATSSSAISNPTSSSCNDIRFELIDTYINEDNHVGSNVACSRDGSFLTPETWSCSSMDWTVSFLLFNLFQSHSYTRHGNARIQSLLNGKGETVLTSFMYQLQVIGLWEAAVSVAVYASRIHDGTSNGVQPAALASSKQKWMHIAKTVFMQNWRRSSSNISSSLSSSSSSLSSSLSSSSSSYLSTCDEVQLWTLEANALLARSERQWPVELSFWEQLNDYNQCHYVLMSQLAPTWMMNESLIPVLRSKLTQIQQNISTCQRPLPCSASQVAFQDSCTWKYHGQMLLALLNVREFATRLVDNNHVGNCIGNGNDVNDGLEGDLEQAMDVLLGKSQGGMLDIDYVLCGISLFDAEELVLRRSVSAHFANEIVYLLNSIVKKTSGNLQQQARALSDCLGLRGTDKKALSMLQSETMDLIMKHDSAGGL